MGTEYTPSNVATYFIDQLREDTTTPSSRHVLHDYFEDRKKDADAPDLSELTPYLMSDSKTEEEAARETAYWEQLTDDLADYLAAEYDFSEAADQPDTAVVDDSTDVDHLYAPGGRAISESIRPDPAQETWMTTILNAEDPDNEDAYMMSVEYLDEQEARDVVQWLIATDQVSDVAHMIEKGIRSAYDAQIRGFAEELVKAGEQDIAKELRNWAAGRDHHPQARHIHEGITAGRDSSIHNAED